MFNLKKSMKSMDYEPPQDDAALEEKLGVNLLDNIIKVRELCSGTSDLLVRQMEVCGMKNVQHKPRHSTMSRRCTWVQRRAAVSMVNSTALSF